MKRLFAGALAGVTVLGLAACAAPAVQRGAAETEKTAAMTEGVRFLLPPPLYHLIPRQPPHLA